VAAAVVGLAIGLAACSSGGGPPAAGTSSPTAAASGFLQDLASGNVSGACGYALPSQQAACNSDFSKAVVKITGLGIGNDIVVGKEALVAVEGTACFGLTTASTECLTNTNANAGLPTAANFASAYAAKFSSSNTYLEALYEQNGQWYVVDAPPTGASGGSGTTPSS
jgi:hypothetical protein